MLLLRRFCILTGGLLLAAGSVLAAESRRAADQPVTRPDADFFLQGEYTGHRSSGQALGVQVVALGDGEFSALVYRGGLPGNGWDGGKCLQLTGRRTGTERAELSGEGGTLVVRGRTAEWRDAPGAPPARLTKTLRRSPTLGAPPPADATVLFAGRDARTFTDGRVTLDHLLVAGADTRDAFGDFSLHLEFRTPYMPAAREQARGNSGVYIQGRYEVQVLDSFGLVPQNNDCGGLYKQRAPRVNMCLPPLTWQTYDIDFTAARFDATGHKTSPARITVRQNGVLIHDQVEITGKTGAGAAEGPDPRPLRLQDHGNPVHFRNVWLIPQTGRTPTGASPGSSHCPCDS